jgi:hypothetical protein
MISDLGNSLGIKNHPICRRAAILLRFNDLSLSRVLLAEALATGTAYSAATETIKLKRSFLRLPEVQEEYSLEKFPRLRTTTDFSMRLAIESTELKHSMLRHTDGLIETSLTVLSPILSALSVMIFTHTIKVIEENSSQYPEVLLRNILNIGRCCPMLRDEILMQCIKQLRENPVEGYEIRIWNLLKNCLKFFPPSDLFENYLESFLLLSVKSKPDLKSILAMNCIRNMHETIFLHGYNSKIVRPWDSSLKSVKVLLQPISPNSTNELLPSNPILSVGTNNKNSKNQPPMYSFLDPAFVSSSPQPLTPVSDPAGVATDSTKIQGGVRGTRDNWIFRFHQLSQEDEDISMAEFNERLFSSNCKMDRNDRVVFLFWVCKYLPSKSSALNILREYSSDSHLFFSLDPTEKSRSRDRRDFIRKLPHIEKGIRVDTIEMKTNAVKQFWSDIICRCMSFENYILNDTRQATRSLKGNSSGSKSAHRSLLSHSISDVALLDTLSSRSQSPHRYSTEDLIPVQIEDAYLSWPIYRELVLVGMEKIAAEFEELQERASNDTLTPKMKNQYNSNSPISNSKEGVPGGIVAAGSVNPSQRQRRNASHNKLPH